MEDAADDLHKKSEAKTHHTGTDCARFKRNCPKIIFQTSFPNTNGTATKQKNSSKIFPKNFPLQGDEVGKGWPKKAIQ
jgi:hypothetical protein